MSGYYDTYEAARILQVAPETIRSWVKRGKLLNGRMIGGRLCWTRHQLSTACDGLRGRNTLTPAASHTSVHEVHCSCGAVAQTTEGFDGFVLAECPTCRTSMAFSTATRYVRRTDMDPAELSVAPSGDAVASKAAMVLVDSMPGAPWVYYIRLGPYVKIGTSVNVRARIGALSLSPGNLLAVVEGSYDVERVTHEMFASLRSFREWFFYEAELKEHVQALQRRIVDRVVEIEQQHQEIPLQRRNRRRRRR